MKPIGNVSMKLNWAEIKEWEIGWALDLTWYGTAA
jgi:ribosomal-protein-alanine N-acetyltransferase